MLKKKNLVVLVLFVIAVICSATDSVAAAEDNFETYTVTASSDSEPTSDLIPIPQTSDLSYVFYAMSLLSAGGCLFLARSGKKK